MKAKPGPVVMPGKSDLWNSNTTWRQILQRFQQRGYSLQIGPAVELWRALRDDVVRNYPTKEDPSDPTIPVNYLRFRLGLLTFVELLQSFRARLLKRHGVKCWEAAKGVRSS